jgi:hypothetical protein
MNVLGTRQVRTEERINVLRKTQVGTNNVVIKG